MKKNSKSEERALKAYPIIMEPLHYLDQIEANDGKNEFDLNGIPRLYFKEGYERAERDLKLTWKDIKMIHDIENSSTQDDDCPGRNSPEYYKEVLKRFRKLKENGRN